MYHFASWWHCVLLVFENKQMSKGTNQMINAAVAVDCFYYMCFCQLANDSSATCLKSNFSPAKSHTQLADNHKSHCLVTWRSRCLLRWEPLLRDHKCVISVWSTVLQLQKHTVFTRCTVSQLPHPQWCGKVLWLMDPCVTLVRSCVVLRWIICLLCCRLSLVLLYIVSCKH